MKTPLLVVVGETASGKSKLALQLAQRFNGEIICADSATVRRGADIGTAKPSLAEQKLVPHHLLNVVAADQAFSAADFKQKAEQAIAEISGRRKLPILVGGSGLYIDSVLFDFQFGQPANPEQRQQLSSLGLDELRQLARQRGLDTSSIDIANPRRLIRLLETNGQPARRKPLRDNTFIIGLQPDRSRLGERIAGRVDIMLKNGLENETKCLVKAYGWQAAALNNIGYAEWQLYFDSRQTLDETRELIIKNTKDLAKRQRTWFKCNKSIHWFTAPVNWGYVVESVTTFLTP